MSDNSENSTYAIPRYDDLKRQYDGKWLEEKEKFQNQLLKFSLIGKLVKSSVSWI